MALNSKQLKSLLITTTILSNFVASDVFAVGDFLSQIKKGTQLKRVEINPNNTKSSTQKSTDGFNTTLLTLAQNTKQNAGSDSKDPDSEWGDTPIALPVVKNKAVTVVTPLKTNKVATVPGNNEVVTQKVTNQAVVSKSTNNKEDPCTQLQNEINILEGNIKRWSLRLQNADDDEEVEKLNEKIKAEENKIKEQNTLLKKLTNKTKGSITNTPLTKPTNATNLSSSDSSPDNSKVNDAASNNATRNKLLDAIKSRRLNNPDNQESQPNSTGATPSPPPSGPSPKILQDNNITKANGKYFSGTTEMLWNNDTKDFYPAPPVSLLNSPTSVMSVKSATSPEGNPDIEKTLINEVTDSYNKQDPSNINSNEQGISGDTVLNVNKSKSDVIVPHTKKEELVLWYNNNNPKGDSEYVYNQIQQLQYSYLLNAVAIEEINKSSHGKNIKASTTYSLNKEKNIIKNEIEKLPEEDKNNFYSSLIIEVSSCDQEVSQEKFFNNKKIQKLVNKSIKNHILHAVHGKTTKSLSTSDIEHSVKNGNEKPIKQELKGNKKFNKITQQSNELKDLNKKLSELKKERNALMDNWYLDPNLAQRSQDEKQNFTTQTKKFAADIKEIEDKINELGQSQKTGFNIPKKGTKPEMTEDQKMRAAEITSARFDGLSEEEIANLKSQKAKLNTLLQPKKDPEQDKTPKNNEGEKKNNKLRNLGGGSGGGPVSMASLLGSIRAKNSDEKEKNGTDEKPDALKMLADSRTQAENSSKYQEETKDEEAKAKNIARMIRKSKINTIMLSVVIFDTKDKTPEQIEKEKIAEAERILSEMDALSSSMNDEAKNHKPLNSAQKHGKSCGMNLDARNKFFHVSTLKKQLDKITNDLDELQSIHDSKVLPEKFKNHKNLINELKKAFTYEKVKDDQNEYFNSPILSGYFEYDTNRMKEELIPLKQREQWSLFQELSAIQESIAEEKRVDAENHKILEARKTYNELVKEVGEEEAYRISIFLGLDLTAKTQTLNTKGKFPARKKSNVDLSSTPTPESGTTTVPGTASSSTPAVDTPSVDDENKEYEADFLTFFNLDDTAPVAPVAPAPTSVAPASTSAPVAQVAPAPAPVAYTAPLPLQVQVQNQIEEKKALDGMNPINSGSITYAINTIISENIANILPTDDFSNIAVAAGDEEVLRAQRVWSKAFASGAKQSGANRFVTKSYGSVIGADIDVIENKLVLGAAFSTSNNDAKVGGSSKIKVSSNVASVYGKYNFTDKIFANGDISYGLLNIKGLLDSNKSKGDLLRASAFFGHNIILNDNSLIITPKIGTSYDAVKVKYKNGDIKSNNLSVNLGISASTNFKVRGNLSVTPSIHGGGKYIVSQKKSSVKFSSTNYDLRDEFAPSYKSPKDMYNLGASVNLSKTDSVSFKVGYDLNFRKDYKSHSGFVKLEVKF